MSWLAARLITGDLPVRAGAAVLVSHADQLGDRHPILDVAMEQLSEDVTGRSRVSLWRPKRVELVTFWSVVRSSPIQGRTIWHFARWSFYLAVDVSGTRMRELMDSPMEKGPR